MCLLKFIFCYIFFCCFYERVFGGSNNKSYIFALKPINCKGIKFLNGVPLLTTGETVDLYVYGQHLTPTLDIGFTKDSGCDYVIQSGLELTDKLGKLGYRGIVTFDPAHSLQPVLSYTNYHICLKEHNDSVWRLQSNGKQVSLMVYEPFFTTWMYVVLIVFCFMVSSLMTGLNLGLMTLDKNELQLLIKAGTNKEKQYARKILPVRRNGNFLVCSLVITATLCNAVSTVAMDLFFTGFFTVVFTTAIIVLCCEILPQSICSAFPLPTGARTICITRLCMLLTSPVSYPLSTLLNFIIRKDVTEIYTKDRLKELLKKTQLPTHEQKIINGTLDFSSKRVEDVMTHLDDCFKLPITAVMDFQTIAAILASGFSRIPIYDKEKTNIQHVLLTKDLALLDPDDKVPVKTLVQASKSTCYYIPKGTSLDKVLSKFKDSRHHMLFVTDDDIVWDKWKFAGRVIGIVTFEDLIEEIFQMEILDETDTIFDNRDKRKVSHIQKTDIISKLLQHRKSTSNSPSADLKLAAYHFLSEIDEFSIKNISPTVLITLLNLDIFYTTSGKMMPQDAIYVRGVPANYFVMVLQGQMEVKIGKEQLKFEAGPFKYFGVEVLGGISSFTPDYTVQSIKKTDYLKIPQALYKAALLATRYERFKEFPNVNRKSEEYKYFLQITDFDVKSKSVSK